MARYRGEARLRVAFFGNHTVGVTTLDTLAETEDVVAVVAHPADPEDGVRYLSVFAHAQRCGWPALRGRADDPVVMAFVRSVKPDLIWVTDYRYLLPPELIGLARLGAVNLHPSLLPAYRGRAPINWAILEGANLLGLTAHFIDEGMDSGDIIAQFEYALSENEDVGDALEKLYPLYRRITREVVEFFHAGRIPRRQQDERLAFSRPARRPEDGLIDWHRSARQVRDLVRAVAAPYPGAYTYLDGKKVVIWRALLSDGALPESTPGTVLALDSTGRPVVRCAEAAVILDRFEAARPVVVGDRFESWT